MKMDNQIAAACDDSCAGSEVNIDNVRSKLIPETTAAQLADLFKALGDPTRLRMLTALAAAELCVCDLATLVGISESAASHQLRFLRTLRLVRSRRDGRMVHYRLDDDHIVGLLAQGLEHVSEAGVRRGR